MNNGRLSELKESAKKNLERLFNPYDSLRVNALGITGGIVPSETQELILGLQGKKPITSNRPDIDGLFRFFRLASKFISGEEHYEGKPKDGVTAMKLRLILVLMLIDARDAVANTRGFDEEQMQYGKSLFDRRDELPKDNVFRRAIVEAFIDEEVYNRFYIEREKGEGRYNTDKEGGEYTPEGAREWDEHFNALCEEYGEKQYKRNFDDAHYLGEWGEITLNNYPDEMFYGGLEIKKLCEEADEVFKREGYKPAFEDDPKEGDTPAC